MSYIQDEQSDPFFKSIFQNNNITGYQVARNNELAVKVRRDSTDFALQIIHHERGRQIICELIDVALRPKTLIDFLHKEQKSAKNIKLLQTKMEEENNPNDEDKKTVGKDEQLKEIQGQNFVEKQKQKQVNEVIYNAVEILTNQYQEFVQFIFDKKEQLIESGALIKDQHINKSQISSDKKQIVESQKIEDINQNEQGWSDCVIMESENHKLTSNEEDEIFQKVNSMSKMSRLALSEYYQSKILDRMLQLFDQPLPIQQTPVSYFNKIMLQFVYQKPEEIMRYLYCGQKTAKKTPTCSRIRKIAAHLYNQSVIELLLHVMELESEGNFFPQEKTQILRVITEQVFTDLQSNNPNRQPLYLKQQQVEQQTQSTQFFTEKINNYIKLLKSLYEKLEDRYEQDKYLTIVKNHFSDVKLFDKIIRFFQSNSYIDRLSLFLIQTLKFDEKNFNAQKAQKSLTASSSNFSFHKNQESSLISYDLKLPKKLLDLIQSAIIELGKPKFSRITQLIEYYELINYWLNVTIESRPQFNGQIFSIEFVNDAVDKMATNQKSNILHNAIKNVIVDFLPKIHNPILFINDQNCRLLPFILNHLQNQQNKFEIKKNKKQKCYQNQLFHIAKMLIKVWEQDKIFLLTKKSDDQKGISQNNFQLSSNSLSNQEKLSKFQWLKEIVHKKQQFYDHLICGDPRKMGEYQDDESSEIIATSSLKNFFKPSLALNQDDKSSNQISTIKQTKDRYADVGQEENQQKEKFQNLKIEDLKQQTNLKTNPKFQNLKIGLENNNSLFESAISPLGGNRSHTFNFDFDALPLDSDSEQVMSQQEDLTLRGNQKLEEMKLMEQKNLNYGVIQGKILKVQSNINVQSIKFSQQVQKNSQELLNCDNYRREQLCKSMEVEDLDMESMNRVESQIVIQYPEDDNLSLGVDSRNSGSKISNQNQNSVIEIIVSERMSCFMKEEGKQNSKMESQKQYQIDELDFDFTKHYSSYLSYDVDALCMELE